METLAKERIWWILTELMTGDKKKIIVKCRLSYKIADQNRLFSNIPDEKIAPDNEPMHISFHYTDSEDAYIVKKITDDLREILQHEAGLIEVKKLFGHRLPKHIFISRVRSETEIKLKQIFDGYGLELLNFIFELDEFSTKKNWHLLTELTTADKNKLVGKCTFISIITDQNKLHSIIPVENEIHNYLKNKESYPNYLDIEDAYIKEKITDDLREILQNEAGFIEVKNLSENLERVRSETEIKLKQILNLYGLELLRQFSLEWKKAKTLKDLRDFLKTEKIKHLYTGEWISPYVDKHKFEFIWEDVPGKEENRFIKFLAKNFGAPDWLEKAKIEKIDDNKTIRVFYENKHFTLKLNDSKTEVKLSSDDYQTEKLIAKSLAVKKSADKLTYIFMPKKYKYPSHAADNALKYFISYKHGKERRKKELGEEWKFF